MSDFFMKPFFISFLAAQFQRNCTRQHFSILVPVPIGIPDLPEDLDNVLEDAETREIRKQRDKKLFSVGRQTSLQLTYICLVLILCSGNRGYHYYSLNNTMKQTFQPITGVSFLE